MQSLKRFLVVVGVALLASSAHADSVLVSTSVPTQVVNIGFFGKSTTLLYPATPSTIWLNSQPIVSTTAFVASGFQLNFTSTTPMNLTDFTGTLYALAPSLASSTTLYFLTGN